MKTPSDKEIAFVFMSEPSALPSLRWKARVVFPAGAGADTPLEIAVTDGANEPVRSARLELAGVRMPVTGGRASMKYSEFVEGKHSTPVWLYREGAPPVPGSLTFA